MSLLDYLILILEEKRDRISQGERGMQLYYCPNCKEEFEIDPEGKLPKGVKEDSKNALILRHHSCKNAVLQRRFCDYGGCLVYPSGEKMMVLNRNFALGNKLFCCQGHLESYVEELTRDRVDRAIRTHHHPFMSFWRKLKTAGGKWND